MDVDIENNAHNEPHDAPRDETVLRSVSQLRLVLHSLRWDPITSCLLLFLFAQFGIWVILAELVVITFIKYREHRRRFQKRRRLFVHGKAVKATITFVGLDECTRMQPTLYAWVAIWKYDVLGREYERKSGLRDMPPDCRIGDEIWVLYDESNPLYAKRWAIFTRPPIELPFADYFKYRWWVFLNPRPTE